jgi:uncharacterized protein (DUF2267 family)
MIRRLGLLAATIGRWARRQLTRQEWLVDRGALSDALVGTTCSDRPESSGLAPLLAVASRAGLDQADGLRLARTTLLTFSWCLPPIERIRFLASLPAGVRRLAAWAPRRTWDRREIHTGEEFVRAVTERSGLAWTLPVDPVTRSMLTVLHDLAGPEADAVAAVLPPGLRPIWTASSAAEHGGFSLARRVWGETPVRGEWGWMQAPVADVHPDLAGTASH